MKKLLLSIVSMLAVASMNAQNVKMYIEVGSSNDLKNIPVTLYMDNDVAITAFQASFALPEGLTKDNFTSFTYGDRATSTHQSDKKEIFTASKPNDLLVSGVSSTFQAFKDNTGALGSFSFDGSSLAEGTYSVKMYTATAFPDANTRYNQEDMDATFTIANGAVSGIDNITVINKTNGIYNIAGQQMNGLQKGINIVDGQKVFVK